MHIFTHLARATSQSFLIRWRLNVSFDWPEATEMKAAQLAKNYVFFLTSHHLCLDSASLEPEIDWVLNHYIAEGCEEIWLLEM